MRNSRQPVRLPWVVASLAGLMVFGLAACSSGSDSAAPGGAASPAREVSVVASTNVYGDIVTQIAGSAVKVTSIISDPDQDPHSYEADAATQLALSKADVVIENGGGYDDFIDSMLKGSTNTAVKLINAVTLSGKTALAGGELNEHVWYDVPTVRKLSDAIV